MIDALPYHCHMFKIKAFTIGYKNILLTRTTTALLCVPHIDHYQIPTTSPNSQRCVVVAGLKAISNKRFQKSRFPTGGFQQAICTGRSQADDFKANDSRR